MWKMRLPPAGDLNAQLTAALVQVNGSVVYELSPEERQSIHDLYARYEELSGEPHHTLNPGALNACRNALHDAYGQVQVSGRLSKMRARLLDAAPECPFCGAAPATTLDHHLPKDEYRSLSINPRNLIPSCQPCNRAKGTLAPAAGEGIIHTYFQTMPEETFLMAQTSYAEGTLVVSFSVNEQVTPALLSARLTFQIGRLKLNDRLAKSVNTFLFELKPGLELLRELPDQREFIRIHLLKAGESFDRSFGLNHWKAAVVRGLAACEAFLDDPWSYLDNEAVFVAELDEEALL
ncbi:hypothetical protein CO662_36635 [Rhizobium anhuiense]|uniref:HNH nuclease domain-containing protein n=1 Tax=Rhizobium anhuiense TaxID=1184720 RepID=A0ABX4IW46_9HYPH|nr:HNH endonuclease [Rhizobium anhuiense]PDS43169.1 hypothetical protein CO668_18845 [Rhizobium anhuiense]PDS45767.1 hypothetical protein CO662_36635 [Rhizobium anhuiense]